MSNRSGRLAKSLGVLCACCVLCAIPQANAATPKVITIAGGHMGNGKPATSASLAHPVGVARDAKGNLYISDDFNCQIRRVNLKGVISKFAGTGICGFSGDGGSATFAMINGPQGLALTARATCCLPMGEMHAFGELLRQGSSPQ